jgi:hypothetical protein
MMIILKSYRSINYKFLLPLGPKKKLASESEKK